MKSSKNLKGKVKAIRILIVAIGIIALITVIWTFVNISNKRTEEVFNTVIEDLLEKNHRNGMEEILNNMDTMQKLMSSIAVTYDTSGESPESQWSKLYFEDLEDLENVSGVKYYSVEQLQDKSVVEQQMHLSETKINALINSGAMAISDVFNSGKYNGINTFCMAMPVRQKGRNIGALVCYIQADMLLAQVDEKRDSMVNRYLMHSNGQIILNGGNDAVGNNFFNKIKEGGAYKKEIGTVENGIGNSAIDNIYTIHQDGKADIHAMFTSIGYNDWVFVSVFQSEDIENYSLLIKQNGEVILVAMTLIILFGLVIVVAIKHSIKKRVNQRQVQYDLLSKFSDVVLFQYDINKKRLTFTNNVMDRFSIDSSEIMEPFEEGKEIKAVNSEDMETLKMLIHRVKTDNSMKHINMIAMRMLDINGEYRWVNLQGDIEFGKDKKPKYIVGKITDIQDQKVKETQLESKTLTDPLTQIYNRRGLEQKVMENMGKCNKGCFMLIDIDDFKHVNDTYGHETGDKVLTEVATALTNVFRKEDVIGRYGGDEFVVFMPDICDQSVIKKRADSVQKSLNDFKEIQIGTSIGIALYPENGTEYESLFNKADEAMYYSKTHGKGQAHISQK